MKRINIEGVPRFFAPYIKDCFTNAVAAFLLYRNLNPEIVLVDYLSFMHDPETGYVGTCYLYSPFIDRELTREMLNTASWYLNSTEYGPDSGSVPQNDLDPEKININNYLTADENKAEEELINCLDQNQPAVVAVDLFYMPYHKAYQKEHGLHYIVITGYDSEQKTFSLFDKYKLSSSDFDGELSCEIIKNARSSLNPVNNPIIGQAKRPLLNRRLDIFIGENFNVSWENTLVIIKESVQRMRGDKKVLGYTCGIPAMKDFINSLIKWKEHPWNERKVHFFRVYYNEVLKYISRNNKHFAAFLKSRESNVPYEDLNPVYSTLEKMYLGWEISSNICLKIAITKKDELIDNLTKKIEEITGYGNTLVNLLDQYYIRRCI